MIDDAQTNEERQALADRLELEMVGIVSADHAFAATVARAERDLTRALGDLDAAIGAAVATRREVYRQLRDVRANRGQPNRPPRRKR